MIFYIETKKYFLNCMEKILIFSTKIGFPSHWDRFIWNPVSNRWTVNSLLDKNIDKNIFKTNNYC